MREKSNRAISFAIRALTGKFRKYEPDVPSVVHSLIVGDLLKFYDFEEDVVAAGYLHDVIEDTIRAEYPITYQDLTREFGGKVSSLVMFVSSPDPSLPWAVKKKMKIKSIRDLSTESLAIITADKIANLESDRINFQKQGYVDYSKLKGDFEEQKGYYEAVYEELSKSFYHPMLERLYQNIRDVFYNENHHFNIDEVTDETIKTLRTNSLEVQKEELSKLKNLLGSPKPFIIEYTKKNTDKQSLLKIFNDFFKTDGFKIKIMDERLNLGKYQTEFITDMASLNLVERNLLVASEIEADLLSLVADGHDIILVERCLFERLIWLQRLINTNKFPLEDFNAYLNFYLPELESLINYCVMNYNENITNSNNYQTAMSNCVALLNNQRLDIYNDDLSNDKVPIKVFERLLPFMRTDYIKQLNLYLAAEAKKE